ncbi:hypothetical protein [Streptomyces harbinensis]|uniref:hypothetical protein n=1 Tax=Streptomyces harbinensis TaxID=1176198 RepID=UPI0034DFD1D3
MADTPPRVTPATTPTAADIPHPGRTVTSLAPTRNTALIEPSAARCHPRTLRARPEKNELATRSLMKNGTWLL